MFLMIAGILLLLHNFDLLHFNLRELIRFWPLLLVYSGLVLLGGNKRNWVVSIAMILITLIFLVLYFVFKNTDTFTI